MFPGTENVDSHHLEPVAASGRASARNRQKEVIMTHLSTTTAAVGAQ